MTRTVAHAFARHPVRRTLGMLVNLGGLVAIASQL